MITPCLLQDVQPWLIQDQPTSCKSAVFGTWGVHMPLSIQYALSGDTSAVPFLVSLLLLQFLFRDPKWSSWAILRCLPSKATIGFSNMRGPAGHWSLSGHPVVRIHNGVQPNAFGCFISLFSYGDTLTFTHTCYTSKTEHPEVCYSLDSSFVGCFSLLHFVFP